VCAFKTSFCVNTVSRTHLDSLNDHLRCLYEETKTIVENELVKRRFVFEEELAKIGISVPEEVWAKIITKAYPPFFESIVPFLDRLFYRHFQY